MEWAQQDPYAGHSRVTRSSTHATATAQTQQHRKAYIPWEQFHCNMLVVNVTGKSLTCYKDVVCVGRVTRMLQGSYEKIALVEFCLNPQE